jgi:peptidoglycan/xylan/chitin deacetylase (PgdA/CDA1 family)
MTAHDDGFVTFDFEGTFGMPRQTGYEIDRSLEEILETLAEGEARATFFVVGELAERSPRLVERIAIAGHEVALHGYRHEHMTQPGSLSRSALAAGLDRAGDAVAAASGRHPLGFRAPHLLAPRCFDAAVYALLAERGYRWASNWHVRDPVELARPDRLRTARPWRAMQRHARWLDGRAAAGLDRALNLDAGRRPERPADRRSSVPSRSRWRCGPWQRAGLVEVPLTVPMDCDLLGLPDPQEPTPPELLAYAEFALERCIGAELAPTVLTFHDWIIVGTGRMPLLAGALRSMRETWQRPVTISERLDRLSAMAGVQ